MKFSQSLSMLACVVLAAAEAAGTSKAVIGVGLGALSLLFSVIASSNFSDNIDCISFFNYSEEDCHEKPVFPFMALGGAALVGDLIYLLTPNQKLAQARSVTRDYYRDQYRNRLKPAPAVSAPGAEGRVPDPVAPRIDRIEPADSVPPEDSIPPADSIP